MPTVYDVNVAGTQTKLSNIYDYNVAGAQTAIQKVYDVTSAGAQTLLYQRKPATIALTDKISYTNPSRKGYTLSPTGSENMRTTAETSAGGWVLYAENYGGYTSPEGSVSWSIPVTAGRKYFISVFATNYNSSSTCLKLATMSGAMSVSMYAGTGAADYAGIATASSTGNAALALTNREAAYSTNYFVVRAVDFVDVTDLVGYIGESAALTLCKNNMRAKSGSRTIAL